ncbi:hypothetical protein P280DRAFT_466971 [Massarina eburnea CBS 473.64]|uniref:Uncharacterized protein n=1 Tax=Massarina eburnea CBS 473.64 TaxID=1395130 RepID=A0A6A6SD48_9PLEO|nr:hypothetical protein P280DRAFT_466971 [Massarina eburnea CBS 473.64]
MWGSAPARYSRAYEHFHRLTPAYTLVELWKTIRGDIDVIIPFCKLPDHVREQLEEKGADILGKKLFDDDAGFQDFVRDNMVKRRNGKIGRASVVRLPAAFEVHSRTCIVEILGQYPSTTFSLGPAPYLDMDDGDTLVDAESSMSTSFTSSSTLTEDEDLVLSCMTLDDAMVEAVKALPVSKERPYRLIERVVGGVSYEAHAFINRGCIRTFVVTTSSGAGAKFLFVVASHVLFDVLYQFTSRLVGTLNNQHTDTYGESSHFMTTHLSITFRVKEEVTSNGDFMRKVIATRCSQDPHVSLLLYSSIPSLHRQFALAYTEPPTYFSTTEDITMIPIALPATNTPWGIYSLPSAAYEVVDVLKSSPLRRTWWLKLARTIMMCWVWGVCFQEQHWDWRDPGPALYLWTTALARKTSQVSSICIIIEMLKTLIQYWIPDQTKRILVMAAHGSWNFCTRMCMLLLEK